MAGGSGEVVVSDTVVSMPAPPGVTYVLAPEGGPAALDLAALVESVLFVAQEPVALADLSRVLEVDRRAVEKALAALEAAGANRGLRLQRADDRVQLVTAPGAADVVARFLGLATSTRLSRPALEVLSVIAYRQPATRPEVDELRGVSSDAALRTLLARGLVAPVGRRATVGHPVEYGTTFQFLEYFGLASLDELPDEPVLPGVAVAPASTEGVDSSAEDLPLADD
jgi:segregation and condensation protein B